MKKHIQSLLLILQFMTRIPINISLPCESEDFKRGSSYIPLVGLSVGGFQFLIYSLLKNFLPTNILAIFILISGILITGGFHIDGLGDTCDGFFAFKGGKDRIIEIMKDSRIGTYSCIAIVIDLLLRYSLYIYTICQNKIYALVLAPIIGRMTIEFIAFIGKRAKDNGSGNLFIGNIDKRQFVYGIFIFSILISLFIKVTNLFNLFTVILWAVLISLLFNNFCNKKINGLTGDSLGAMNELAEIFALIIIVVLK